MIPQGGSLGNNQSVQSVQQPSKTYRIDMTTGRIVGVVDGIDAVKQAVWMILQTERYEHEILGNDYGIETKGIIGADRSVLPSMLKRSVREALLRDDRITDVTDFVVIFNGDEALATFTVVTQFGKFEAQKGIQS